MAANGRLELLNENLTANKTGERKSLPSVTVDHVAILIVENNTGSTIAGDIEHSPDGTNWLVLDSFTGGATDPYVEVVDIGNTPLGSVRANLTVAGGAGADVKCEIRYDSRK